MTFWQRLFGGSPRKRFADQMMARIRDAGLSDEIEFDEDDFSLRLADDGNRMVYLANLYEEIKDCPRQMIRTEMDRFVRALQTPELPKRFEDARDHLLPRVRDRAYYPLLGLRFALDGNDPLETDRVVVAEELTASLAFDAPDAIIEMTRSIESLWSVSFDQAMEVAMLNLRELSQEPFVQVAPGLWESPWGDNYDAARMLVTELFYRIELRGEPVVTVPNRDVLLVAGSEDESGLEALAERTRREVEHPRLISGGVFVLDDHVWSPFTPESPELAARFAAIKRRIRGGDYNDQKDLLDALHESEDVDVFVATYSIFVDEATGLERGYCVWSRDVDTLLPETEVVAFHDDRVGDDGATFMAPWSRVIEIVGDRLEPTEHYPPRWRARSFPSDEELLGLRAAAQDEP